MRILGIESSADESGVSMIEAHGDPIREQRASNGAGFGADFSFKILGNAVASQIATHTQYGGIFPSMAVREHQKNFVPLLETVLMEAKMAHAGSTPIDGIDAILTRETELRAQLTPFLQTHVRPDLDAIAVTYGPGLEPTLWVGINFAKALAHAWQLPLVAINHMEGHVILSALAGEKDAISKKIKFPLLSLLISGGHTELVFSREWMQYKIIGQTRDDAVGEAFDKVARLLGLPYPGGPEISRLAAEARQQLSRRRLAKQGDALISLPRPMIDSDNYDFSFAGLKTAVRRVVETSRPLTDEIKKVIALEFENACSDVLVAKTMRAIEEYGAESILVGGGVSANTHIRESIANAIKDYGYNTKLLIPPPELATDNALMIALAGYFRAQKKEFAEPDSIRANGNLKLA